MHVSKIKLIRECPYYDPLPLFPRILVIVQAVVLRFCQTGQTRLHKVVESLNHSCWRFVLNETPSLRAKLLFVFQIKNQTKMEVAVSSPHPDHLARHSRLRNLKLHVQTAVKRNQNNNTEKRRIISNKK